MDPGAMALTLMFLSPNSLAADLVRPITPCLLATYAALPANPMTLSIADLQELGEECTHHALDGGYVDN
jgi:hypothetical protein